MNGAGFLFAAFGGICLILGGLYPAVAMAMYPIYRRNGGTQSFREYIDTL